MEKSRRAGPRGGFSSRKLILQKQIPSAGPQRFVLFHAHHRCAVIPGQRVAVQQHPLRGGQAGANVG